MFPKLSGMPLLACGLFVAVSQAAPLAASSPNASVAVVRLASGMVTVSDAASPDKAREVKAGDLPDSGAVFSTGAGGALTLRFHPDMTLVELPASSRAMVGFSSLDPSSPRRVEVRAGGALVRVAKGVSAALEDAHAEALVRAGRVAYATGPESATLLVFEGEARVFNRRTGATDVVEAGGKAVADAAGTKVTKADARELAAAGFRQSVLEVDFWNPATEEYRTLEVEYEARPSAP